MYISVFVLMYVYVLFVCLMPVEARRGYQIPWNWRYTWLLAALWMLGIELRSPRKVVQDLSL